MGIRRATMTDVNTAASADRRLLGRRAECEKIDDVLAAVVRRESSALVIRGEAGIGKTALLDYAAQRASIHGRVLRASGVGSEMEMPFAGLHQLLLPILDLVALLPGPQRDAFEAAFGRRSGVPADRLMVALAALNLLSGAAESGPVFCVVDDAQWLDQASLHTLLFTARRLLAEPIGLVLAARGDAGTFAGLPELPVDGLQDRDALRLLGSVVRGRLDPRVSRRILAETHGNPLAIVQLSRGLTAAELSAGFGPSAGLSLSGQIEQSFRRRYLQLSEPARRLLIVAAAEPLGDPSLLREAAAVAGLDDHAVASVDTDGLMVIGLHAQFEHPLARSAIYGAATADERQAAHRAIAQAIRPDADRDQRAWHRSQAATGPDDEIASELEAASGRALARGGLAASAALLERAGLLSKDPDEAVRRGSAAARATYEAGGPDRALELIAVLESERRGTVKPLERAMMTQLRGRITVSLGRPQDAISLLLEAALALRTLDATSSRATYLEALEATMYAGRFGPAGGLSAMADDVMALLPDPPDEPGVVDFLLDGLLTWAIQGLAQAVPALRRALVGLSSSTVDTTALARWAWLAYHIAISMWDDDQWLALTERYRASVRAAGALSLLPSALLGSAGFEVRTGEFAAAEALLEDALDISTAIGSPPTAAVVTAAIAAWRGLRSETETAIDRVPRDGSANGVHDSTLANYCLAVLNNGLGEYAAALAAARASAYEQQLALPVLLLPELIEAAAHLGDHGEAERALARLSADTTATGTHWGLGIEAYCRAILAHRDVAETLFREAIAHLDECRIAPFRHRARLAFGEWLRRERRRIEAREQLQTAYDGFTAMGADGFAERARRELVATGFSANRRDGQARDKLTPQELQVVRLATENASNQEIATQLFISPSTVSYHLGKAFRKLGINSRRELGNALAVAR